MINKLSGLLVFLGMLSSCGTFPAGMNATQENRVDQIVFMNLQATRDNNQMNIVEISTQMVPGSIKSTITIPENFDNPVEVQLQDSKKRTLQILWIENPLIRILEFTEADGRLNKLTQLSDSADFFIRFNRFPELQFLRFQSIHTSPPLINQQIKIGK